jgi:cation transport ATPase
VLHVLRDGEVVGAFALEDEVRAESRARPSMPCTSGA